MGMTREGGAVLQGLQSSCAGKQETLAPASRLWIALRWHWVPDTVIDSGGEAKIKACRA